MEVKRISTVECFADGYYLHKFKVKNVIQDIEDVNKIQIIKLVFNVNSRYLVEVNRKDKSWDTDIVIIARTTDTTPNNAINRSAWILRQLDKLIGLKLED